MNFLLSKTAWLALLFILINLQSYAQPDPSLPPGSNFDLSAWKIHTLDSIYKYIEIYSSQLVAGYTSEFFYTNPNDGSMVFRVPSNGEPTTTSSCPRSELRQMTQGANWLLTDTTEHYLEAECKVITVASAKPQTIIGQIHGSETVSQILKLRWSGTNAGQCYIDAQFKTNDWDKTDYTIKLITGLSLGDLISYKISMKAGKITVNINDHITSYTYSNTYYGTSDKYYFKAGNYLQYSSSDSSIYGLVQFYKLSLKKSPATGINKSDFNELMQFHIDRNYPNPFNPTTTIKYQIFKSGLVTLKVYDTLGRELKTLVDENKISGLYKVNFNASQLPTGVYFYRMQAGSSIETNKMVLLK